MHDNPELRNIPLCSGNQRQPLVLAHDPGVEEWLCKQKEEAEEREVCASSCRAPELWTPGDGDPHSIL